MIGEDDEENLPSSTEKEETIVVVKPFAACVSNITPLTIIGFQLPKLCEEL